MLGPFLVLPKVRQLAKLMQARVDATMSTGEARRLFCYFRRQGAILGNDRGRTAAQATSLLVAG